MTEPRSTLSIRNGPVLVTCCSDGDLVLVNISTRDTAGHLQVPQCLVPGLIHALSITALYIESLKGEKA